jgi:Xaa-Pro aminopeptidase
MRIARTILLFVIATTGSFAQQNDGSFFANRRALLASSLGNGILILSADRDQDINRSEYRQENYFWYLTGYPEPGAIAVIDPTSKYKFTLYLNRIPFIMEIYGGAQPSFQTVKQQYNADTVIAMNYFAPYLQGVAEQKRKIYSISTNPDFNYSRRGDPIVSQLKVMDASPFLDEMRMIKDALEIQMMRKAATVTSQALIDAYKICKPNMFEYEVEALIEYDYRKAGMPMPAYRSIVASGSNATILHYDWNKKQMKDGELLLMDVGAECGMYAADITRTIPVNGKFSAEQRTIYELVLKAEEEGIKLMKPGRGNLECHHRTMEVFTEGLVKLGLMTDPSSVWQKKLYNIYRVNHWLGLDVHDVGSYGPSTGNFREYMFDPTEKGRPFEPGMVSTIEPGLYFRSDLLDKIKQLAGDDIPQREIDDFLAKVKPIYLKYMNIGVRIEDDVLITKDGNEVLTADAPKSLQAIEEMMKR